MIRSADLPEPGIVPDSRAAAEGHDRMLATGRCSRVVIAIFFALLAGCSGDGPPADTGTPGTGPSEPETPCTGEAFASTFEGIQKVIFEKHGCTQQVCHGSAAQGGLELSPDVAYAEPRRGARRSAARSTRVEPGDKDRSYLWLKLAAATDPGTRRRSPARRCRTASPPISEDELEALRLWIYAGAPETGTVGGTEKLLDACLPPPEPITIKPLDPPAAGRGRPVRHAAVAICRRSSEHEICFATYYDITRSGAGRVPRPERPAASASTGRSCARIRRATT